MRTCAYCAASYAPTGRCQRYCTTRCRGKASYRRYAPTRLCKICETPLQIGRARKLYCSDACYRVQTRQWINTWARKSYRDNPLYRASRIDSVCRRYAKIKRADELTVRRIASLLWRTCAYCHKTGGTIDHIIPLARGGEHHWSNLLPCCQSCNSRKKDRHVLEFIGLTPQEIAEIVA